MVAEALSGGEELRSAGRPGIGRKEDDDHPFPIDQVIYLIGPHDHQHIFRGENAVPGQHIQNGVHGKEVAAITLSFIICFPDPLYKYAEHLQFLYL